ncbi:MAG: hypothetical protein RIS91_1261 [Bacteroidota bacterium]|jgi:hypothetical protein
MEENKEYLKYKRDVFTEKYEKYIHDVLNPHLPNFEIAIATTSGYDSFQLSMSPFGKVLGGSQFYYNEGNTFVHFTNLDAAQKILSDGCIHLSGLNTSSDKNEILLNLKPFLTNSKIFRDEENIKSGFLNLSMSPFNSDRNESIQSSYENLKNNFYGFGKDFPIALVIEIDFNNRNDWYKYHLSKVEYSDKNDSAPQFFENLIKNTNKWITENKYEVTGLENAIYPLLSFFKESKYSIENEIRLIKSPIDTTDNPRYYTHPFLNGVYINSRKEIVPIEKLYFESNKREQIIQILKLDEPGRTFFQNQFPRITLKKILLPTHKTRAELHLVKNLLNALSKSHNMNIEFLFMEFHENHKEVHLFD